MFQESAKKLLFLVYTEAGETANLLCVHVRWFTAAGYRCGL